MKLSSIIRPVTMSWDAYKKYRFMKHRGRKYKGDFKKLIYPFQNGLISVLFFVVDTDIDGFRNVINQLLNQTYMIFELWIIFKDDQILDDLSSQIPAELQERIRIITVLSEDEESCCANPHGEFLTWLDPSSLLAPDFFDHNVAKLRDNPALHIVNANFDKQNTSFRNPFMMRSLVAWLLGYIPRSNLISEWTTFWRHTDLMLNNHSWGHSALADGSLEDPNRGREPNNPVDENEVETDYRQDFLLSPGVFRIIEKGTSQCSIRLSQQLKNAIVKTGNCFDNADNPPSDGLPALWTSRTILVITDDPGASYPELRELSKNAFVGLICCAIHNPPNSVSKEWNAGFIFGRNLADLPDMDGAFQGWIGIQDVLSALSFMDARAHLYHLKRLEDAIKQKETLTLRASIIITTYRRTSALRHALSSAVEQTFPKRDFEIIVVNNDPQDQGVCMVIEEITAEKSLRPEIIRQINCVIPGLSHARNAGLSAASGEIICFLDDDAMAREPWLEHVIDAFSAHPETGVIGGHILLKYVEPRPKILLEGLERYWTHFQTSYQDYTEVSNWLEFPWGANWCARREALYEIGGFRTQYGRTKKDFSGGEEIIAASLAKKLGYSIAILPNAIVDHCPDPGRYTFRYLCNTIAAQSIINYRMSRDLYLPKNVSMAHNLRGVRNFIHRFSQIFSLPIQQRKARMVEIFCFLKAWPRLFFEQMNDNFWRTFYHE